MRACWSCAAAAEGDVCSACGKLQPPRTNDHFAYLGIPRAYHLDVEKLGELMRERSRTLHPDRFARAEPRERSLSMQHTTLLNDAVRTLRDPQRRAEYVLSLYGLKAGSNDRPGAKLEPMFLMEMMETREALAEARAKSDAASLAKIVAAAKVEQASLQTQADAKFTVWEKNSAEKKPLEQIVGILDKMRYFEQILAEAEGRTTH